jgi:hypothetical protein
MNYRPNGRRQLGKPVDEAESVSLRNNSWRMMMMMMIKYFICIRRIKYINTVQNKSTPMAAKIRKRASMLHYTYIC